MPACRPIDTHPSDPKMATGFRTGFTTARPPGTRAAQYAAVPLEGRGPHTQPRPTVIHGAGPKHLWDGETKEWLRAAPKPHTGWRGDVLSLVWAPLSPRLVLRTANILRATEIRAWGRDAATVRWFPPGRGGHPADRGAFPKNRAYVR